MAIMKLTAPVESIKGRIGDVVLRRYGDRIIVAKRPAKRTKLSEKQQQQIELFRQAAAFAKEQMKDPATKKMYEKQALKKGYSNAYTAAVTSYLKTPGLT